MYELTRKKSTAEISGQPTQFHVIPQFVDLYHSISRGIFELWTIKSSHFGEQFSTSLEAIWSCGLHWWQHSGNTISACTSLHDPRSHWSSCSDLSRMETDQEDKDLRASELAPQNNSVALVRERTIPTNRPPLVDVVSANYCG
jgi:hypothetical protein